jgi:hypothetical protein
MAGGLQPEAAIINATMLPSLLVLHASAHKALTAAQRGGLRSRTLHSELVFGLSGSKHVRGRGRGVCARASRPSPRLTAAHVRARR